MSVKDEQCRGLLEIAASNSSCCRAVIDLLFENGVKLDPRAISCAVQSGCKEAEAVLKEKKGKKKSLKKPYDIVRASLEGILANDELELVPRKWHLIGDVLLLQSVEKKLLEVKITLFRFVLPSFFLRLIFLFTRTFFFLFWF